MSMNQSLQQWRLAHDIEDAAFESLKAVIHQHEPSPENFSAGSLTVTEPWRSQATSMLIPTSEVCPSTGSVPPIHSAGAAPSTAIISEHVEDSVWCPVIAQQKDHPIACVKCWAEKKVYLWTPRYYDQWLISLVRLGNAMQEMHRFLRSVSTRENRFSFAPSILATQVASMEVSLFHRKTN